MLDNTILVKKSYFIILYYKVRDKGLTKRVILSRKAARLVLFNISRVLILS